MRHARPRPSRLTPVRAEVSALARDLLELVHPQACCACASPGRPLCRGCEWAFRGEPFRQVLTPEPPGLPPIYAVTEYDGIARQAIIAWKERSHRGLVEPLGLALARAVAAGVSDERPVHLIPVPPSRASLKTRGEDVLMRVAERASRALREQGLTATTTSALALSRTPMDQAGLDARARRANLAGAMRADTRRRRGIAVVVDDVVTTGATLAEASRALSIVGWTPHCAATIAATVRRGYRDRCE